MSATLTTTKKIYGLRAVDAKRGKRIGKVRRFVFHPSERRCIGFTVKRPDAALMFHRKDLFVALGGCHIQDGQVVVHDDAAATDKGAIRALGVDWDACVLWVGMPVVTQSGDMLGYVDVVSFDSVTGSVSSISTEEGVANNVIVGRRVIPATHIKGFRRGAGVALASMDQHVGEDAPEEVDLGAIMVDDAALDIPAQGGAAAMAGKATAVAADKAKKSVVKAKAIAGETAEAAKPAARKAAKRTGQAVEAGTFAVGKQLGKASGMFAAFKEEFEKASKDQDE